MATGWGVRAVTWSGMEERGGEEIKRVEVKAHGRRGSGKARPGNVVRSRDSRPSSPSPDIRYEDDTKIVQSKSPCWEVDIRKGGDEVVASEQAKQVKQVGISHVHQHDQRRGRGTHTHTHTHTHAHARVHGQTYTPRPKEKGGRS